MYDCLAVGDKVAESPVGAGEVTGYSERGYPQVNRVTVTWVKLTDGTVYDPHGKVGGNKLGLKPGTSSAKIIPFPVNKVGSVISKDESTVASSHVDTHNGE